MFKDHVKYAIRCQQDDSYVVVRKDVAKKGLTIHSHHDTYDEAQDELESLHSKPSKAEAMKIIRDLRFSMDSINNK
jgi:hypothetical protein